jgi:putative transposase
MKKTYLVQLDATARTKLTKMLNGGKWPARSLKRARALLLADVSTLTDGQLPLTDEQVASKAGCGRNTVQRLRQRFCEEGLDAALVGKSPPGKARILNPSQEQRLVALACTTPPNGADHWTLSLLVEAAIAHKITPAISKEAVRQVMLRHELKPWRKKNVVHSKTR